MTNPKQKCKMQATAGHQNLLREEAQPSTLKSLTGLFAWKPPRWQSYNGNASTFAPTPLPSFFGPERKQ